MRQIDLNCDLGEGFPHDAELIALASSVNIACGGHAGDADTMRRAIDLAAVAGVNIGAHPSYEDRVNFGRLAVSIPPAALRSSLEQQVRRLHAITTAAGARLTHVKPHGALYHAANADAESASAVVSAIVAVDPKLMIVGPPKGQLATTADGAGVVAIAEAFADRRYRADGTLVTRGELGAVIDNVAEAAGQALDIALRHRVTTADGQTIALAAETLCVHGDGATAVTLLRSLRLMLEASGVAVRSFGRV